jgi:hypothetical protein
MRLSLKSYSRIAILLLGGLGTRFGSSKPKQFLPMGGQPLCLYGAKASKKAPVDYIVYVVPKGYERNFALILEKAGHAKAFGRSSSAAPPAKNRGHLAVRYLLAHGAPRGARPASGWRSASAQRTLHLKKISPAREARRLRHRDPLFGFGRDLQSPRDLIDGYIPREEVYLLQTPQAFRDRLIVQSDGTRGRSQTNFQR